MFGLGEIIAHWWQGFAVAGAMKIRGDDADLGGNAAGAAFVDLPRGLFVHLGIVETEHGNGRTHHVHWLGRFRRSFYEIDHGTRELALGTQRTRKFIQLAAVWQLALPQEVNDFLVVNLAGKLVDIVTAVDELSLVSDDVAQARGVRDDAFQSARYRHDFPFIRAINVSAIVAGVSATAMPARLSASIFPAAVPWPPDTIAPA